MTLRKAPRSILLPIVLGLSLSLACGGGGGGASTPASTPATQTVAISVTPSTASVQTGATQAFTATVTGSTNTAVTWTTSAGTITTGGVLTAPATAGTVTVTATSQADTTKTASATVTVTSAPPAPTVSVSVAPGTASVQTGATQAFTATVTGSTNTAVTWTTSAGTITTAGVLTAPATAGTVTVTATSQADPTKTASATVTVTTSAPAPTVSVSVAPGTASVQAGATQAFTATVTGSTNTAVTWTTSAGSITTTGILTAPTTAGTVTVTATSQADTTKKATAIVTVTASAPAVTISVSPTAVAMNTGATQAFTASVTGTSNMAVTWTASAGTITSAGAFTAPATAGTVTVTATSQADTTQKATASVTVTAPAPLVTVSVNPTAVSLATNATQTFTATVTGSSNTTVTWTATAGTISAAGLFVAPATAGTVTVKATSQADASVFASATVTVTAPSSSTGGLTLGQVANPNGRYFSGYYPTWSDNWFTAFDGSGKVKSDDAIYQTSHFAQVPGVYTHIMVAFAQPDFAWQGLAANTWTGTGLNFNASPADIKEAVRILHQLNKKVIISVGGATYGNWTTLAGEAGKTGPTKTALTQFLVDMGFDGLDVDYEIGDASPAAVTQFVQAIQAMREAVDAAGANRQLGIAAWSTGADYTATTPTDATYTALYKAPSYWSGSAGRERLAFPQVLATGPRSGQSVGSLFDLVDVMSYDAQTLHYDPVTAYDEYRDLVPATVPVSIGLEIAPEGWAGGLLVVHNSESSASVAGTFVAADQYGRTPRGAYSVERFGSYVLANTKKANPHDGLMLWTVLNTTSVAAGSAQTANATTVAAYVTTLFGYVPTAPVGTPAQGVTVAVSPQGASLAVGTTLQFNATVSGSSNPAVTWTCTGGTISSTGLFTAGNTAGSATVTATSAADTTKTAMASLTLTANTPVVAVSVTPTSATVSQGATQAFAATVTGSSNTSVTWTCTGGTITSTGVFTAGTTSGSFSVTATAAADATKTATAAITISAPSSGGTGNSSAAFAVKFSRTSSWSGGYNADITLTNTGSTTVSTWTLSFTSADTVTSSWNANQATAGQTVTFTPLSWNASIAPGGSITVGIGANTTASGGWAPPATATVNGQTVTVTTQIGSGSGAATPTLGLTGYDQTGAPAMSMLVAQGSTQIPLTASGQTAAAFTVDNNNPRALTATISGSNLIIQSKDANGGRAGLRITETTSGAVRYVGVRVKDTTGATPGFPKYVSMGVVSEDGDADMGMFNSFGTGDKNRYVDNRYIYLNGGPINGWWTWSNIPGDRARTSVRNSLKIGAIPTFVWYNIPDGGESYTTDLSHVQDAAYMKAYFQLLSDTLKIFNEEAPNEPIMMVMEPDCLGYMMQLSGKTPDQIQAFASAAKDAGLWTSADPIYPDTLAGLVSTINHIIKRDAPQVKFGWQFNVWASLDGTVNAPNAPKSLMKVTDTDQQGWAAGRQTIYNNAMRIAAYYKAANITTEGASFISFDKYGLDAVGYQSTAAADPNGSTWFWNADHWNNYLYFVKTLHEATNLPVALWQLPVGRINSSQAQNPYSADGTFADLDNTTNKYEDSTASFFFGDTFLPGTDVRTSYFAANASTDSGTVHSGPSITWAAHIQAAKDAGVFNLMFGDGVGMSTKARPVTAGAAAPDGWWLMTAIQRYHTVPVALP